MSCFRLLFISTIFPFSFIMNRIFPVIQISLFLVFCSSRGIAQEESSPSVAISYQDIGPKFHIDGRFGPLFKECKVKGIVVSPPDKRDRSEDAKSVWLEIKSVDGKDYPHVVSEHVYTDDKFVVGAEVELIITEKATLVAGDDISYLMSQSNRPKGKMLCILSLHHRRTVSNHPPKK